MKKLFTQLRELDEETAEGLNESDRQNPRRLIRAIEIELLPPDKGDRGSYIPYNPKLKKLAQKNRKSPTRAEELLWYRLLQGKQMKGYKFLRQKPIDNFIVDFYCSELMLAIEIDGDTHSKQEKHDNKRTTKLNSFGVQVIRYNNSDILSNLEGVYNDLTKKIARKPSLTLPYQGGNEKLPP